MHTKTFTYNIPGCGNLQSHLYPYAATLYDFLEELGHIRRLRRINQLGYLRNIYQGAHHSRYEYVFLQQALITELCQQKGNNSGLGTKKKYFGKVNSLGKHPTTGEILQCLTLLTNMGFMEGTFTSNRAYLGLLRNNPKALSSFKKGLNSVDRQGLQDVVDDFEYYKFQHYVSLFLLQRYRHKNPELVDFCCRLLREFIRHNDKRLEVRKIWRLYYNIRRISYITLDCFYAPIPFSLDLSSILLGFGDLHGDLFIRNSAHNRAISQIEKTLQETVYLTGDSCLTTGMYATAELVELTNYAKSFKGNRIGEINDLFCVACDDETVNFYEYAPAPWESERIATFTFTYKEKFKDIVRNQFYDELNLRTQISGTSAFVGFLSNPKKDTLKLAIGLKPTNQLTELRQALKAASGAASIFRKIGNYWQQDKIENGKQLLQFILQRIFKSDIRFLLDNHRTWVNAVIISSGKTTGLKTMNKYISNVSRIHPDELFEVTQTVKMFELIGNKRLTLTYVGNTKLYNHVEGQEVAEFDGVMIRLTEDIRKPFLYILEAKNYSNGHTFARKQLKKRLDEQLPLDLFKYNIVKMNNKTCYAEISLK